MENKPGEILAYQQFGKGVNTKYKLSTPSPEIFSVVERMNMRFVADFDQLQYLLSMKEAVYGLYKGYVLLSRRSIFGLTCPVNDRTGEWYDPSVILLEPELLGALCDDERNRIIQTISEFERLPVVELKHSILLHPESTSSPDGTINKSLGDLSKAAA